ncbi:hypothetical protein IX317_001850 [Fusobacterium sp. DD29]|uniref:hypothetical protein n=1 Tax=unclassified Fusobacterium TaxID=2648384 RepID=UPI001B8D7CEB|nr:MULTISPECIES: hypothetical protein [unclassified Fusobacterium]MBR8701152.1 hypothetical protein [Fusobacterium sp. DD45]MBR8711335.1 hypothetical protein [Fusobacterium sp. DD28]MBR8750166.1 hypothetical protein [Fusobacterium sp. DD29]MBR8751884.1 hypothetical protein [Fusobacterium sp. DD26]MBR8762408.1 hypothetical protein [Fusobacterium sp. DD25]
MKDSYEARGLFRGNYPFIVQSLGLKTSVEPGDIIAIDSTGNYGKYDESTYTQVYAVATQGVTYSSSTVECEAVLTGYLVKDFIKFKDSGTPDKVLKQIQELKKVGIIIG